MDSKDKRKPNSFNMDVFNGNQKIMNDKDKEKENANEDGVEDEHYEEEEEEYEEEEEVDESNENDSNDSYECFVYHEDFSNNKKTNNNTSRGNIDKINSSRPNNLKPNPRSPNTSHSRINKIEAHSKEKNEDRKKFCKSNIVKNDNIHDNIMEFKDHNENDISSIHNKSATELQFNNKQDNLANVYSQRHQKKKSITDRNSFNRSVSPNNPKNEKNSLTPNKIGIKPIELPNKHKINPQPNIIQTEEMDEVEDEQIIQTPVKHDQIDENNEKKLLSSGSNFNQNIHNSNNSTNNNLNNLNHNTSIKKDFAQYDVQSLAYDLMKEYTNVRIDKDEKFLDRMCFDIYRRQNKDKRFDLLIERYKHKISEEERTSTFNRLIEDANRRLEAQENLEDLKNKLEDIQSNLKENQNKKRFNKENFEDYYYKQMMIKMQHEAKMKEIRDNKMLEKQIKEEEEAKLIPKKKAPKYVVENSSLRLYNEAERRRLKQVSLLKDKGNEEEINKIKKALGRDRDNKNKGKDEGNTKLMRERSLTPSMLKNNSNKKTKNKKPKNKEKYNFQSENEFINDLSSEGDEEENDNDNDINNNSHHSSDYNKKSSTKFNQSNINVSKWKQKNLFKNSNNVSNNNETNKIKREPKPIINMTQNYIFDENPNEIEDEEEECIAKDVPKPFNTSIVNNNNITTRDINNSLRRNPENTSNRLNKNQKQEARRKSLPQKYIPDNLAEEIVEKILKNKFNEIFN